MNTIEMNRTKPSEPEATGLHAGRLAAIKDAYTGAEASGLIDRRLEQLSGMSDLPAAYSDAHAEEREREDFDRLSVPDRFDGGRLS